jgi:hypothetical protein
MTGTSLVALKTFKHNGGGPGKGLQIDVITVLRSLADRFAQACIGTAIIGNTHGNAPFGLSPSNLRCPKRMFVFSFNEGPYFPNRCALMSSRHGEQEAQSELGQFSIFFGGRTNGNTLGCGRAARNRAHDGATFTRSKKSWTAASSTGATAAMD